MEEEYLLSNLKHAICRICSIQSTDQYCMYEIIFKDGTLSMHMMLEKLVPSVFNAEQMKVDEYMGWPRKICEDCRVKVLEAYGLYEQCMMSGDLLRECFARKPISLEIEEDDNDDLTLKEDYATENTVEVVSEFVDREETPELEECAVDEEPSLDQTIKQTNRGKRMTTKQRVTHVTEPRTPTPTDDIQYLADESDEQTVSTRKSASKKVTRKTTTRRSTSSKSKSTSGGSGKVQRSTRTSARKATEKIKEESTNETDEPQTKIDLYRCLLCDAPTYTSPKEHTEHLKQEHPDQIHSCELCPKVFMTKAAYEHHQYCHATGRSFFCTFCDKGFQTEQLLKNHMRTHTHGTGFLCSHCGQEFSNRSNLRQHLIRHTGEKPWQCELCPSRFSMKSYLDRHMHTHTKAKFFSCDSCGSQFSRHYSLVKHQLIHTGFRHFTCEVCDMKFTSSHHVKRHMLTHTGEKPFKCTYCERSFTQSNDMVKHMKTHVGSNPYQCDRCDASFRLLTDLRNHYQEHYQGGSKEALSGEDDKSYIRFTSTDILKMRYAKEMNQCGEKASTGVVKQKQSVDGEEQAM